MLRREFILLAFIVFQAHMDNFVQTNVNYPLFHLYIFESVVILVADCNQCEICNFEFSGLLTSIVNNSKVLPYHILFVVIYPLSSLLPGMGVIIHVPALFGLKVFFHSNKLS